MDTKKLLRLIVYLLVVVVAVFVLQYVLALLAFPAPIETVILLMFAVLLLWGLLSAFGLA